MQPDPQPDQPFRDYRWGTVCPVHGLRHWCTPCRRGGGHGGLHTCACGATHAA